MTDTLASDAMHAVEIRHSRFLAHATHAATPEAAMHYITSVSEGAATHNCWAWRIGGEYRSSDAGEPAGSAGRPILAAIDGQGFDQVALVVARWFGGIKLGVGGLVRAYGGCASECLRLAPRRPLVRMRALSLACGFDDLGNVHAALATFSASKTDEGFDADGARLSLQLPAHFVEPLKTRLRDATRNRVRFPEESAHE